MLEDWWCCISSVYKACSRIVWNCLFIWHNEFSGSNDGEKKEAILSIISVGSESSDIVVDSYFKEWWLADWAVLYT
jgi:hypothetical protein